MSHLDGTLTSSVGPVFQRWGCVWEVYVAHRRNYAGYKYGFVRFKGVKEIRRLERHLD